jgi:hypothetical protein
MEKNRFNATVFTMAILSGICVFVCRTGVFAAATASVATDTSALSKLSVKDAFDNLKKDDYIFDQALFAQATNSAFAQRKSEAIGAGISVLRSPRVALINGKKTVRTDEFRVAKMIFQQFPAESLSALEKEFTGAGPVLKSNILMVLPVFGNGRSTDDMLIKALDDTRDCEEVYPGDEGIPLRVCDIAYNELVLLWQAKDVLRTIGVIHRIEMRDYHIGILKTKLNDYRRI